MADSLARMDWKMGQTLLPEHFRAQEDALIGDMAARLALAGVPLHGLGRLSWNESLLEQGILSISKLALILPIGQYLQVPGNARAQSFNLNATGATRTPVYLHLTSERVPVIDEADGPDGERLERYARSIVLSSEQVQRDAVFTMKLAEFDKGVEGGWSLTPSFIPPLVQVGVSPFLQDLLERLASALPLFQEKLQEDIAASYLGGEGLAGAKTCLKALYTFQRLLNNVAAQVHVHPYTFCEALKVFYAEVCFYQDRTPEEITSAYRHDDLAGTFAAVARPLLEHLRLEKGKAPYVPFTRKDGMFQLPTLPEEVRGAKEVFLLVQKPRLGESVPIEALKLAARSRVAAVHRLSLVGIPLRRIERPPFQHQFGSEVEFFQLGFGEEWDLALREGALAFFETPSVAKARAFLYWRRA